MGLHITFPFTVMVCLLKTVTFSSILDHFFYERDHQNDANEFVGRNPLENS